MEATEPSTPVYDRQQVIENCKGDLNFLGGICVPDVFTYFFPAIFIAIWGLLVDAVKKPTGLLQLAIGIPRGFAKTAFLKLFVVYCILFTDRKFILVVCNTEQLALNFIADVMDILSSANIKVLFGDWKLGIEKDTQALKKFGFRGRDIILAGIGVGTSMRGLNLKFRRPDVIIMDDMQSREDAEQKIVAQKQLIWMMGTLMKARSYERCLFVFVGNMYPFEDCILRKLKYNKTWISFICGGILADGKSLWEELRPLESLLAELENDIAMGHPEIFYSEVLNDEEAGTVSGIDVSKIPAYPQELDSLEPQGGFIVIDPASGKKQGNDVAIGVFFIYDGKPLLKTMEAGKFSPLETIHTALRLALTHRIKVICVESNAYQYTLLFWFDFVCQQLQISGIDLCELFAGAMSKNSKIKNMLPQLTKGEILLHPSVRSQVVHQIVHWNPLKMNNTDDLLDLLAWTYRAIELYGTSMELMGSINVSVDASPEALQFENGEAIGNWENARAANRLPI
jgi:hypothetical protein